MRILNRRVVIGFALGVFAAAVTYAQTPPADFLKAKEARDVARRAGNEQEWGR